MERKTASFFTLNSLALWFHTLKYLKWQQVFYRLYYPLLSFVYREQRIRQAHIAAALSHRQGAFPVFSVSRGLLFMPGHTFHFLNCTHAFGDRIDWHFRDSGLLWTFNLHYFEWLNDDRICKAHRLETIRQYTDEKERSGVFTHSYPASLRIPNWIRFIITYKIEDRKILSDLYRQSCRLARFPEYNIMGNHLLENGIALCWSGIFFGDNGLLLKGKAILYAQLEQQILDDGAHFEKAPAYHSIILKSLLELMVFSTRSAPDFLCDHVLKGYCTSMLSFLWLLQKKMGAAAHLGDSNEGMSVPAGEIKDVAQHLHIIAKPVMLSGSGIRIMGGKQFNVLFNSGNIPASYQPGHSHADAFHFSLTVNGLPLIVDRGISTYERGALRMLQRSTQAHNTVCIAEHSSSDIWSAFRMGKRASVAVLLDQADRLEAMHKGFYSKYRIIHKRSIFVEDYQLTIEDELNGWKGQSAKMYLHFYPGIRLVKEGNRWQISGMDCSVELENADTYLEEYDYCIGFNCIIVAERIVGVINNKNVKTLIKTRYE